MNTALRACAFGIGVGGFAVLQVILWADTAGSWWMAIVTRPWLWVLYFIPVLLIAEHAFRLLKRLAERL